MKETLIKVINEHDNQKDALITPETELELHSSSKLDILLTYRPIDVCSNEHSHEGYEFFVPFSYSPYLKSLFVEDTIIDFHPGALIPTNPWQIHGAKGDFTIYSSLCIYISQETMRNIAYSITGIKELTFLNKANPYNKNLQHLVNLFVRESQEKKSGYKLLLESLSTQIIIELLRNTVNSSSEKMNRRETGLQLSILKVVEYLHDNFNQNLTNVELLNIANLSPYYFIRLFKKETGRTPQQYLLELKIDKAKELLSISNYSITEICFICGFSEHSHNSKVFKKITGLSPFAYRKLHKS